MNHTEVHQERPFKRSPITSQLVQMAIASEIGQTITYAEMEKATHCSKAKLIDFCQSAVKILRRDYQIVWHNQPGVGFKRLDNDEIAPVSTARHTLRAAQNARTFGEKLACQNVSKLSPSARHERSHALAIQSFMAKTADPEVHKTIKSAIVRNLQPPDFFSILSGLQSD